MTTVPLTTERRDANIDLHFTHQLEIAKSKAAPKQTAQPQMLQNAKNPSVECTASIPVRAQAAFKVSIVVYCRTKLSCILFLLYIICLPVS